MRPTVLDRLVVRPALQCSRVIAPSDGRLAVPSVWCAHVLAYQGHTRSCGAHIGEAMPMSTPKGSRT
jgi:hypothetical protein